MAQRVEGRTPSRRRGPRPGTPRVPRLSRAERGRQLLDVAEATFAEQGYSETTMEQIAARAGITKPVIYDHFGSKERLLSAVVARNRTELLDATASALDALGSRALPEEYFRAGVRAFMEFFERRQPSFRAYQQQAAILAAAGGDIEQLRRAQARDIADRLGLLPQFPDVADEVRMGLAEIVIATNERVTAWWLRHPEVPLDGAVELVMSVLWSGFGSMLRPPTPSSEEHAEPGGSRAARAGQAMPSAIPSRMSCSEVTTCAPGESATTTPRS